MGDVMVKYFNENQQDKEEQPEDGDIDVFMKVSDTDAALQFLRQLYNQTLIGQTKNQPRIFTNFQIYSLLNDKKLVERELKSLQDSNQVLSFKLVQSGVHLILIYHSEFVDFLSAQEKRMMLEEKKPEQKQKLKHVYKFYREFLQEQARAKNTILTQQIKSLWKGFVQKIHQSQGQANAQSLDLDIIYNEQVQLKKRKRARMPAKEQILKVIQQRQLIQQDNTKEEILLIHRKVQQVKSMANQNQRCSTEQNYYALAFNETMTYLLKLGLFVRSTNLEELYFAVPDIGPVVDSLMQARHDMLLKLKRTKRKQLQEKELFEVQIKGRLVTPESVVRDLIGQGIVARQNFSAGIFYKLT